MAEEKKQIFLWHGANDYEISERISAWSRIFQKKYSALNIIFFDFEADPGREEWHAKIKNALQVNSLFGLNKLVIFKNFLAPAARLSEETKQLAAGALARLSPTFFIVFSEKEKMDARNIVYQEIQRLAKEGKAEIKKFDLPMASALPDWIAAKAKKYGACFSAEAIGVLCALIGNDLWRIDKEIHKLSNCRKGGKITETDVSALVRGKFSDDIFALTDALSAKNKKRAMQLVIEQLNAGASDMYLLTMLARQFRIFIQLKELVGAGQTNADEIASVLKIHPYVAKKSLQYVKNFSAAQLRKIFRRLLEIEYQIKTGASDFETQIGLLIAEL